MTFDAEAFKSAAISDANADRYTPIPEGTYTGTIIASEPAAGESAKGPWARLDVTVNIEDPTTGRVRGVRGGIMLDLTESGGLAVGPNRNVKLGQLRTAIGKNQPGVPFSWGDAVGHEVSVYIKHRADKNDPEKLYEDIASFKAAH